MSSPKPEAQHDEVAPKRSTGQFLKNFIRRTWWMWLIVIVVIVVILVPVLLLVVYPHIAQSAVNKTTLTVLDQKAFTPTPSSIALEINNTFHIDSAYHPILYPFNTSLYLDENSTVPFISFTSPQIDHIKNGSISLVQATVPIENPTEFAAFTKKALVSGQFDVILKGKGKLKQASFPKTNVNYNQKASIVGMSGLTDLTVSNVTLLNSSLSDGSNAQSTVYIYNPSVITLDLGNVSLSLTGPAPNRTALGTSTLINAVLKPGNNSVPSNIVSNILGIASIITNDKRYGCARFPVTITGNNVTYNGVDLPYYTSAIQTVNLTTTLDLQTTLEDAGFGSLIGTCES